MKHLFFLFLFLIFTITYSQQVADENFNPPIANPTYETGKGPIVFIDEGHHNFHTKNGRYQAFAKLLERDGYKVLSYSGTFDRNRLEQGKVLVISNALNKINIDNWYLPNPSAFTIAEIEIIRQWVYDGGRLFLIADHMPMAGAAKELAKNFGFEFTNGFAMDTIRRGPAIFNLKEKTLIESSITKGRKPFENIHQIATFTGQAFKIPKDATSILTFNKNYVNMLPDTAWVFDKNTNIYSVKGWSQGAYKKFGKGRVVCFGEAAMFTAQLAGDQKYKFGMNNEIAPENFQLLLNIMHWLDGTLD